MVGFEQRVARLEPLKVTYEELAEQPEPVVRRVLDHLETDPPAQRQWRGGLATAPTGETAG